MTMKAADCSVLRPLVGIDWWVLDLGLRSLACSTRRVDKSSTPVDPKSPLRPLKQVFGGSHDVTIVRASDDLECVRSAHLVVPELASLEWEVRHALVCESRRNVPGEWLIGQSRLA